jgi:hypothetical protein
MTSSQRWFYEALFWLQRVHGPYHSFIFCKLSHYFLGGTGIPRRKRADLPTGAKNLSTTPAISFPKRLSLGALVNADVMSVVD